LALSLLAPVGARPVYQTAVFDAKRGSSPASC
jgi:hypothetical protein